MGTSRVLAASAFLLWGLAPPAEARVAFTGYGDLRFNAGTRARLYGDAAALTALGISDTRLEARGFQAEAVGLFAATELKEDLQFLMDVTYRDVGAEVGRVQVQYAYLDYVPREGTTLRGGKLTLPLGYYNENRFYGFRRYPVGAPFFQSGILGLPIADWGVTASHKVPLESLTVEMTAFSVNGYGHSGSAGDSFRRPTVPGALAVSGNLRPSDNNHKQSFGGRLAFRELGGTDTETGFSYYRGEWNAAGTQPLQMMFAHVHAARWGFDVLWEALQLDVKGDQGFAAAVGSPDWRTRGHAATVSYEAAKLWGKTVAPYLQAEDYGTRASGGGSAEEKLRAASAGAALLVLDNLRLKAEYQRLYYRLPFAALGSSVRIDAHLFNLAAVMTY